MEDSQAVFLDFYNEHKRLPSINEYKSEYIKVLKSGNIVNPLPDGWTMSYKKLRDGAYMSLEVKISAGSNSATFILTMNK